MKSLKSLLLIASVANTSFWMTASAAASGTAGGAPTMLLRHHLPASLALAPLQSAEPALEVPAPTAPVRAPAADTSVATAAPRLDVELPVRTERIDPWVNWAQEDRRLKIRAGLSGGFAAAMVLSGVLLFVLPNRGCGAGDNCDGGAISYPVGFSMFTLAMIPTGTGIYYGVKRHRHNKARPTSVLRPTLGGFSLNF